MVLSLVWPAPQDKSGSILSWARTAKPACELAPRAAPEGLELATFAGGCFWGLELAFQVSTRLGARCRSSMAPTTH